MGRKLLLTPSGDPRRALKHTVGTVTESQKMLTLQALSSSLIAGTAKGGPAWAEERLLGALRQSVPQNGRVHLHITEMGCWRSVPRGFFPGTPHSVGHSLLDEGPERLLQIAGHVTTPVSQRAVRDL